MAVLVKLTGRVACCWLCLLFCISGGATAGRIAENFGPKFQWFDEHRDDFEIVFVGSSRIAHGISPKLFDETAGEHGHQWRSFNLGRDKMKQDECLALARHEAALRPRKLQYLFLELQTTAGGAGGDWRESRSGGLGPDGDGYFPLTRSMSDEMRPRYEQLLRAEKNHPVTRTVNSAVRDELTRFQQAMKAQGIEVVFVVAPSLRAARGAEVNAPPGSLVFSFDDPMRYPGLFAEANRPDAEHLNTGGAEIFTRNLATEFVQALASPSR